MLENMFCFFVDFFDLFEDVFDEVVLFGLGQSDPCVLC